MDFFAQFFVWLNGQLSNYVGSKTAAVAGAIEPAAVTMGVVYVMVWGYLCLRGQIQEPILDGFKRIAVLAIVLGVGLRLWLYNTVITDTVYNAPDQLAAAIVGAPNTISVIDQAWLNGNLVAEELLKKGSVLSGDFAYYLAGFIVYLIVGLAVVYAAFLLALSKVAVAVILAIGPLFIVLLLFDSTKRFFESWVAQLANYALIGVVALMVAALMLSIVKAYADSAAASGSGVTIAESVRLCIAAVLVFLVMRQVPAMAAGLASGIALSSFGAVSGLLHWGLGTARLTAYDVGRGVMDGWSGEPRSRWDSLRRGAGNRLGSGLGSLRDHATGSRRTGGTLVPRDRVIPPPGGFR